MINKNRLDDNVYYNLGLAVDVGANAATLYNSISYWVERNKELKSQHNFRDGEYWTYSSNSDFSERFPCFSPSQVRTALNKLVDKNYIKESKVNYNKYKFDQTKWYTTTGKFVSKSSSNETSNASDDYKSKPDVSDIKSDINNNSSEINHNCELRYIPEATDKNRSTIPIKYTVNYQDTTTNIDSSKKISNRQSFNLIREDSNFLKYVPTTCRGTKEKAFNIVDRLVKKSRGKFTPEQVMLKAMEYYQRQDIVNQVQENKSKNEPDGKYVKHLTTLLNSFGVDDILNDENEPPLSKAEQKEIDRAEKVELCIGFFINDGNWIKEILGPKPTFDKEWNVTVPNSLCVLTDEQLNYVKKMKTQKVSS